MWSQMHGDEPTATSALVDLFHYFQENRKIPWVAAIEKSMTIRAVPMLNPDGAELYQRRNLQFIDINRDARALVTPEGRLLKRLRDEWKPDIGFNLHNQGARTAVGSSGRQATISLLAVPFDEYGNDNPGRVRNKKICAVIIESLAPFIYGHIARYDDTFNPRAFGDLISKWGTPVVLIETGALDGKSEMDLVQLNFVALAFAMNALASGAIERANPALYDALRVNEGGTIYSLIVRNATVVNRFETGSGFVPPFTADVAINEESHSAGGRQRQSNIQEVGDLQDFRGLVEVDASRFFVTVAKGALRPGNEGSLLFYKKDKSRQIDWAATDLETRFPPDATYKNGAWTGKENLIFKK
jgi:Zinc carboxypeptidase